jgi:Tfp pilus assembly protein PilF
MSIEIDDKNVRKHGKQVEMLLQSALEALHINGGKKAEGLLQEALEIEPNEVDLLNNLAMTYQLQGRLDEAHTMVRQIHTRHPDYLLGRTALAMIYIQEGDLEHAEEILEPLRWLKQMNHSEFDAFCVTYIELFLAKKKKEMAKSWFEMWKSVNPENSKLERYRFRFDRSMVVSKKR